MKVRRRSTNHDGRNEPVGLLREGRNQIRRNGSGRETYRDTNLNSLWKRRGVEGVQFASSMLVDGLVQTFVTGWR